MSVLVKLVLWVLGLCGFGKPDPEKTGEQLETGREAKEVLDELASQRSHSGDPVPDRVRDSTYRD